MEKKELAAVVTGERPNLKTNHLGSNEEVREAKVIVSFGDAVPSWLNSSARNALDSISSSAVDVVKGEKSDGLD